MKPIDEIEIRQHRDRLIKEMDRDERPREKAIKYGIKSLSDNELMAIIFSTGLKGAFAIHKFFQDKGFVYLNTPLITASDCEGAGAMFQVTTLPLDKLPRTEDSKVDYSKDFFGKPTALTVSGQLEGELGATALGEIYTFGPTFRAENSNTPRHLSEFWMIEPEMAFYDIIDNMNLDRKSVV